MKVKDGFKGQRLIACPLDQLNMAETNPMSKDLQIHSLGFYPNAFAHYYERPNGCSEYILIYCVNGEGWYEFNKQKVVVKTNDFFVLPAEAAHAYGSSMESPWSIYWIHFKGEKAHLIYQKLEGKRNIAVDTDSRLEDRKHDFDELLNVMDGTLTEENYLYANLSLGQLLSSFVYPQSYRKALFSDNSTLISNFVNLATHYMYENLYRNLSLKEIASHFGYSESYFNRLFCKEIKDSPKHYFLKIKINKACQLLRNTNLKVNQISSRLGFECPLYFSRYFKKIMHLSPQEYRKANSSK